MSPGGLLDRGRATVRRARERSPLLDHVVGTVEHYLAVDGNAQAAAATYFGFLSFFPVLAIAFFVVGRVAAVYPDAHEDLRAVLDSLLPGLVGDGPAQVPLSLFEENAGRVGLAGLLGGVYAGSNWLSGVRTALAAVFRLAPEDRLDLLRGKLRDVLTMLVVALTLATSVAVSGLVSGLSSETLEAVGVGGAASYAVLWLVGHAVAVGATTVLFSVLYRLLAPGHLHPRSLLEGAVIGAVLFEVLKALAYVLIGYTQQQAAFAAFGIALVLVVWINYTSRILLLGAAWAQTSERRLGGGRMEP